MARPLRIQFAGAWYHVMHRGASKQNVFLNDKDRFYFLTLLNELVITYGVEIHAYCLMGNHYHLIIHTPRGNLTEAMRHLNSKYTQKFNFHHSRDGALFRGRYKSILISAQDYLIQLSRYIHRNPIEAGFAKNLRKYKWSSYRYYLDSIPPPDWLTTIEIKIHFGTNNFNARYEHFVENPLNTDIGDICNTTSPPPVLGGKDFCEQVFEKLASESLSVEIVGKNRILAPPTLNEILDIVASHFDIDPSLLLKRQTPKVNFPPRNLAIYLCRKVGSMKLSEIGDHFGKLAYTAVSNRVKKVELDNKLKSLATRLMVKLRKNSKTLLETSELKVKGKT